MGKALSKFLMTLAATTVSIVLTFGTTAIIDHCKQKAEKREMVRMIMYDMRETLREIERCDGNVKNFFDVQVDVVAHPEKFAGSYVPLAATYPILEYTTTTESIFRSNIETLRTIGNILFIQTVSSFYDVREQYRSDIVEGFQAQAQTALEHFEALQDFDSPAFAFRSELYLRKMQRDFEQCKLMMKVTDQELDAFSSQQEKLLESVSINAGEEAAKATTDYSQRSKQLQKARAAAKAQ